MRFEDSLTSVQSKNRLTWSPASLSLREPSAASARPATAFSAVLAARARFDTSAFELLLLKMHCLLLELLDLTNPQAYDLRTLMPKYVSLMLVIL
jgi:hypothetical protein